MVRLLTSLIKLEKQGERYRVTIYSSTGTGNDEYRYLIGMEYGQTV
jgi:hypothetical protein